MISDGTTLHTIDSNEFLDSPEFESSRASVEDKFRVLILNSKTNKNLMFYYNARRYRLSPL